MATRWTGGLVLALGLTTLGGACSAPHQAPPAAAPQAPPAAVPDAAPETRHPVGLRLIKLSRGRSRPLPTLLFYPAQALNPGRPSTANAGPATWLPSTHPTTTGPVAATDRTTGTAAGPAAAKPTTAAAAPPAAIARAANPAVATAGPVTVAFAAPAPTATATATAAFLPDLSLEKVTRLPQKSGASGRDRAKLTSSERMPDARKPREREPVSRRPIARPREGRPAAQAIDAVLDTQLPGSGVRCRAARGRFPLVLFSHGMSGSPQRLAAALAGWAAAGFVVAAPAYPYTKEHTPDYRRADIVNQPDDLRLVLAKVRALDRTPGDPLRGRIDVDRVAAIGHSAGGYTTSGLFVAGHDPRLRSAVIMSGWRAPGAFAGPPAQMLFLQGTADPVVPMAKSRAAYDRVPWPKRYLVLPRVSHANYLRPGDRGYPVMEKVVVDFLRRTLRIPPNRNSLAAGP